MPRRPRCFISDYVFHVFNRAIQDAWLFEGAAEYGRFLELLAEAGERFHLQLFAFTLMPNHWHLVVRATDDRGLVVCRWGRWGREDFGWRGSACGTSLARSGFRSTYRQAIVKR